MGLKGAVAGLEKIGQGVARGSWTGVVLSRGQSRVINLVVLSLSYRRVFKTVYVKAFTVYNLDLAVAACSAFGDNVPHTSSSPGC